MNIPCFLLTPTTQAEVTLRRYCHDVPGKKCPGPFGSHDAEVAISVEEYQNYRGNIEDVVRSDERWPVKCAACEYLFVKEDEWQTNHHLLYGRSDAQEPVTIRKAPVGAMWYVDWGTDYTGPDGKTLIVKVPAKLPDGTPYAHEWCIDGRASNCTLPEDSVHRCWCRHGTPPNVTVNKIPEKGQTTCSAGGGSIATPGWHGYLTAGNLHE